MNSNKKPPTPAHGDPIPSFLDPIFWQHVIVTLALSPQQARIVRLILQGKQDKEIAGAIGISRHTVRSHLRLLFSREAMEDRGELVLRLFELYADCRHNQAADESVAANLPTN